MNRRKFMMSLGVVGGNILSFPTISFAETFKTLINNWIPFEYKEFNDFKGSSVEILNEH